VKLAQIPRTELRLSAMGLGTWAMGGGEWSHGWGPQDREASLATIRQALELGINWIDTAPVYGLGHAESLLKSALSGHPEVMVATKCGLVWEPGAHTYRACLKADSIRTEVEASLKRLGRGCIDLCQIHWPTPKQDLAEAWDALHQLATAGKIRYAGLCNVNVEQIGKLHALYPVASVQLPYNMIERGIGRVTLQYCAEREIGVLVYAPMRAGLLSGAMSLERVERLPPTDWRRASADFTAPLLGINLQLVEQLRNLAGELSVSVAQLAIAWALTPRSVCAAIVGARDASQIQETAQAAEIRLSRSTLKQIDSLLDELDSAVRRQRSASRTVSFRR